MAQDTDKILDLCQYQQIRAALGVTAIELPNVHIEQSNLSTELDIDLRSWLPDNNELSDYIYAAIQVASPDPDDVLLYNCLIGYATYFCAASFLDAGEIRFLKSISDGENTASRQSGLDFENLRNIVGGRMQKFKDYILGAAGETVEVAIPPIFSAVPRVYDPVTGQTQ